MRIVEIIKNKTRDEWQEEVRERWVNARIWMQEHGEMAAGAAFVLGVLLVTLIKFFLFLLAVGVILAFIAYHLAPEHHGCQEGEPHISPAEQAERTDRSAEGEEPAIPVQ